MTIKSRAFSSWLSMMRRCYIDSCESFKHYGGRGVVVCERWFDWRNFLADMGERPEGMSLDRIDNSGIYEPGNCRWTNSQAQNRNTRSNVHVCVNGKQMLAIDAAKELGVHQSTISRRISRGTPILGRQPLKLQVIDVQKIKNDLRRGKSKTKLAKEFSVSRQHIAGIEKGLSWGWVE